MSQVPSATVYNYAPDLLIAGETHLASRSYTLALGQSVARGTVLGQVTTTGKLIVCLPGATDGSQVPIGISIDAYDATLFDVAGCGIYEKGEFNQNAVILGAGWTAASIHSALRDAGIYLKPVVAASGQYIG